MVAFEQVHQMLLAEGLTFDQYRGLYLDENGIPLDIDVQNIVEEYLQGMDQAAQEQLGGTRSKLEHLYPPPIDRDEHDDDVSTYISHKSQRPKTALSVTQSKISRVTQLSRLENALKAEKHERLKLEEELEKMKLKTDTFSKMLINN